MTYALIWLHFLADFYFQSDQMAKGKSSSNRWLTIHVLMYMGVMLAGLSFFNAAVNAPSTKIIPTSTFVLINGMFHWCVDFFTSRVTKKLWEQKRVHEFFIVIGFDQAVHMTALLWSAGVLLA